MEKIQRIQSLVKQLSIASKAYYADDNPIMTDKNYDQLYDELQTLEQKTGYILSSSPTQKVQGEILPFLKKVKHTEPMLSAEKSKDINDILKFMGNQECVLSWKLDGCFDRNMKVFMADGTKKKIKDVKVGDVVLSFNENTKIMNHNKVINVFNNGRKSIDQWKRLGVYNCKTNNKNSVHVTNNHKFLTPNGWKEVKDINEGDYVYTYDYILSSSQQSVLIGAGLGDGCAIKRCKDNIGVEFRYSKVNKAPYNILLEKYKQLFKDKLGNTRKSISGYNSEIHTAYVKTLKNIPKEMNNSDNILRTGYTFTEEILNLMTPLSLAMYYMDDGSKETCQNDGYENTKNIKVRARLSTYRHNIEEVERLSRYLKDKYKINNTIRLERKNKTEGSGAVIDILTDGTEIFFDLIAPYIPKEIRPYKLGLKDKWQNAEEIKWWEDIGEMGLCKNEVKEIKPLEIKRGKNGLGKHLTAYDLEIENDHTYIVEGFAVHNCTIVLRYKDGKLEKCLTRGGGEEGEDVTHTVKTFTNIPLTIDYKGYLEIRGEGLVTFKDFERINTELIDKGQEPYSSPRNLAAGSVRQLNANITKDRNLIFIAFGIVKCDNQIFYKDLQFQFLESLGFQVVEYHMVAKSDLVTVIDLFKEKLENLPYLTDGLIIEFNDIVYGKTQGVTRHHTKNMFALKWQDDCSETKFRGVELNTTRTGMVSITGLFDETDIDGVKVSRASLHNYDIFQALQLGIGDTITVYRANAVIPQIEDNLTRSNTYQIKMKCPSCGGDIVIKTPKEARFLFCENEGCPSKLINRFVHFCSKDAMNIDGLSEAGIELFINQGWLKTFDDLYNLQQYKSKIIGLEGWGIRSYNKLISAIEKSKKVKMANFIYALGIPQIGKGSSKIIAKHFKDDWFVFEEALVNGFDFTRLEDFGDITNQSLYDWYKDDNERRMWIKLSYILEFEKEEKKESGFKSLEGLTFVVTGNVETFKNRKELEELITSLNGKLSGSVSSKTNYLINNDVTSTSGKNKKAKELNVPIISEQMFNDMIGR